MADPRAARRLVTELPLDLLWRYAQQDRWGQPRDEAKFRALVADIAVRGVREPLRLRYGFNSAGLPVALVVNGNHRLAVAVRLGVPWLPVSLEPELWPWDHQDARVMAPVDLEALVAVCQADACAYRHPGCSAAVHPWVL